MRRYPLVFPVLLSLTACTAIPVSSIIALSRVDIMTTDLSRLRIALSVPPALRPRPGGVFMDVKIVKGEEPEVTKAIRLEETADPSDLVGLNSAGSGGQTVHVYKLSEEALVELIDVRNDAVAQKTKNRKGSLSMGVAAREFCLNGDLPKGKLLATTWLATSETKGYVVLLRDFNLLAEKQVAESIATMPRCSAE